MASIHLGRVRDTRLMARRLDARQGGCFRRLRRWRVWRSSERQSRFHGEHEQDQSCRPEEPQQEEKRCRDHCHATSSGEHAHAERARRRSRITSFATDKTAASASPPRPITGKSARVNFGDAFESLIVPSSSVPPSFSPRSSPIAPGRRPSRACLLHSSSPCWAALPKFPTLLPQPLLFLGETH